LQFKSFGLYEKLTLSPKGYNCNSPGQRPGYKSVTTSQPERLQD
jgi:hypothetical protein